MAIEQFKRDPAYKPHYLFHRTLPPKMVHSQDENDYLLTRKGWKPVYLHQAWPQTRYHKDFSLDVERAPDTQDFFNAQGLVDERAHQKAKAARDKQRQRAIRTVRDEADCKKLGPDWMVYAELPAEKARLKQEEIDNAADVALYGGMDDDDDFDATGDEDVKVLGEPLRKVRGQKTAIT